MELDRSVKDKGVSGEYDVGVNLWSFQTTVCTSDKGREVTSEFLSMMQTTESVNDTTDKFLERSLFVWSMSRMKE